MYDVRLLANKSDCLQEGYVSCIEAYIDGQWAGSLNYVDNPGQPRPYLLVQEQEGVMASTAIEACHKFKRWLLEGLDKSYLLSNMQV